MHKWSEEMLKCAKMKIDSMGIDNIDDYTRCELKDWTEIACNIAKADYHIKIVDAMEKAEKETEDKYYTTPRYDNGGLRPDMRRRGYEDMYYRDMDMNDGRMYYTDAQPQAMNDGGARGYRRGYSQYDRAMRGYEEAKSQNPHDDEENSENVKEILKVFKKDIDGIKDGMSSKEKTTTRTELLNIANSIV